MGDSLVGFQGLRGYDGRLRKPGFEVVVVNIDAIFFQKVACFLNRLLVWRLRSGSAKHEITRLDSTNVQRNHRLAEARIAEHAG
jgi:hypothetical protein